MTTTTATLTDFLLARIAEDEAAARAATQGRWKLWGMTVMADLAGTSNVDHAVEVAATFSTNEHGRLATFDADHIARHDPARVLAECEAKRRIVELHVSTSDYSEPWDNACSAETYLAKPEDCEELRALAAIWSDHAEFRAEWAL